MAAVEDTTTSRELTSAASAAEMLWIEGVATPIFAVDLEGRVKGWNRKMAALTGISVIDVQCKAFGDFILKVDDSNEDAESWKVALRIALESSEGTSSCCEISLPSKNLGHSQHCPRRFEVRVSSNQSSDGGNVIGAVCFVTERDQKRPAVQMNGSVAHQQNGTSYKRVAVANEDDDPFLRGLRDLLDACETPLFAVDSSGQINYWNVKMAEIAGYSKNEANQKPFLETCIAPCHHEELQTILDKAVQGQGSALFEMDLRTKFGDVRKMLATATPWKNPGDNNNASIENGAFIVAQQVMATTAQAKAKAERDNNFEYLLETANLPIFGVDCNGLVNLWNKKTVELTGFTKAEAFGKPFVESFAVADLKDSTNDIMDKALKGESTDSFELRLRAKNSDDTLHLLFTASTRRDPSNEQIVGVVGRAQDVTERDKVIAGIALELRQLIDTANAPIFGIDVNGNINEWNRRTQNLTGYSKPEALGKPLVQSFIAQPTQQKVQEILDAALRGNETSNYELEFKTKAGESRFVVVNATTRRDLESNVVGVVGVGQDVTEDRKHSAELQNMQYLQATQAAKVDTERNMTAYFAHELRNPLSAIDNALTSMPGDISESAKTVVAGMKQCCDFMSMIMSNLLDVRKMEEGEVNLNIMPISLKALLSRVYGMLQSAVKPDVSFSMECNTEKKDWVLGDQYRLVQVFTNVAANAIKYTIKGTIVMTMRWEGELATFECIDSGPGIAKDAQEKLFTRFVQRGAAPGAGLGLAITKHLVDLMGGFVAIDSDPSVAVGTRFTIQMPLKPCEAPDSAPAAAKKEVDDDRMLDAPVRFLIVDDIKINRSMLKRRIEKNICPRCIVQECATGEQALEVCGQEVFDVIVVDQYMEEAGGIMVGTDAIYAMRRMRVEAIIIGCSGNALDSEFTEAGADFTWQKPLPSNQSIIQQLRSRLAARYEDI